MSQTWFCSDTHFNHAAILQHTSRAFFSIKDHDDEIISTINQHVKRDDILWMLGDFCWGASRAGHYRARINCRQLHCMRGNHDSSSLRAHVSTMEMLAIKKFGGIMTTLCHYPLESWPHKEHGGWHLHGHCHGRLLLRPNRLDVGLDAAFAFLGELRPFSLDDLLAIMPRIG